MVLKSTIFPEWYADHIQPWLQLRLSFLPFSLRLHLPLAPHAYLPRSSSSSPPPYSKRNNSYVPVSVDYTDLWAIMAFFRGGKHGEGAHDELAKEIAYAGKDWAEKHWRMIVGPLSISVPRLALVGSVDMTRALTSR